MIYFAPKQEEKGWEGIHFIAQASLLSIKLMENPHLENYNSELLYESVEARAKGQNISITETLSIHTAAPLKKSFIKEHLGRVKTCWWDDMGSHLVKKVVVKQMFIAPQESIVILNSLFHISFK